MRPPSENVSDLVRGFALKNLFSLIVVRLWEIIFRMVYKSGQIFLPFRHNPRVWQTDRQTDGQRDSFLIARPRLHCMQRGKTTLRLWDNVGYNKLGRSFDHLYFLLTEKKRSSNHDMFYLEQEHL